MTVGVIFAISLIASFIITFLLEKKFIPFLMRIKMGQVILDIGPRWHKSKEGTPTMGGIFFILPVMLITLIFAVYDTATRGDMRVLTTVLMCLAFGAIGFIDDYTKFVKKQNQGLTAKEKLVMQLAVSAIYVILMVRLGYASTSLILPFTDMTLDLGWLYYLIMPVFISFVVNSVNLTDGIDGLASSVTLVIAVLFSTLTIMSGRGAEGALCGALVGGLIGFLCYNINPARIFMGDTGSLFLGGTVVGLSFLFDRPVLIVFAGLWYIIEAVSVVLQVFSFKVFHKRIFKMAPIHHHFEMLGNSENKIVIGTSLFTALMCIVAYFAF